MVVGAVADDLLTHIVEAQEQLRLEGDGALATYRARVRLGQGYQAEGSVRQFTIEFGEPVAAGGTDNGPAPTEYVLAALGACQALVYATFARLLQVPIDDLSLRVTGDLDPRGVYGVADMPPGFRSVRFDVQIQSAADTAAVARLIETVNQHCPVLDILQRPIPVIGRYSQNGVALQVAG
jgi:putative redox protein